ncbi:amidohydrolase family protein [Sphingobium boeckii]|uniref:Imidazolonepropionase-like amidohydrolase n=1 Tax=Sphingobium boeckii TaxID=1082345 RepID=A0A7W9AJZ8_9SPHN|nr:amidohydrolase family protein [Sphingobium boeckii]MBB5686829.1 imidazolonepropionase-like amidohydrolase [Sphingobium boeckii]
MRNALGLVLFLACAGSVLIERATLIRGARVFDGTGTPARVLDVLIRRDRIAAMGRRLTVPEARVIDARGMTLIPGLHDLHIHTIPEAFASAETLSAAHRPFLESGVTAMNEYSVGGDRLAAIRAVAADPAVKAAHLALALRVGVPGGHGTESDFVRAITTLATTPEEARAAMARLLPFRPDVIKVFADGWRYGRGGDKSDMDLPTLSAIVQAAHAQGVPVVTHTVTLAGAKMAARAGVDAVVHGVGDALADGELIALMRASGMAYVPTLAVYEPQPDRQLLPAEWDRLRPEDRAREEARRAAPIEPIADYDAQRWAIMRENVRILHAAGLPIGIGTDTGIGGVYPGLATVREIRLLTGLGFTPRQALSAATVGSARIMDRQGRDGRIARGRGADLVLVAGRPDERIEDLYAVRRVWVSGRLVVGD